MSLRSKVWVSVGLLCVSVAARAEYKEVWNPPEAAQHARHSKHVAGAGASKRVHAGKSAPHVKVAAKAAIPSGKTKTTGAAVKTAHAPAPRDSSQKPARAKPAVAATKPHQVAQSSAPQASAQPPRELPPILH
ncbi:hypothetical protein K788_0000997 [Paraburkholderia caribensis MBA4]|uniref:Transcriptional regulator n=1 Tax=Paraburkholderia caribensis MBA4 TaxID=1323664 RepID=A0A0P0RH60_9BURK|nr:hypothetical protein [Paraburkholderia caribensis]ALL67887.1 hypothetical protein K788_0000997 [Paraburkholderia caribensis MBA4]